MISQIIIQASWLKIRLTFYGLNFKNQNQDWDFLRTAVTLFLVSGLMYISEKENGRWKRRTCMSYVRCVFGKKISWNYTSFSFFRLSSRVNTTALYCSTVALAFFSCSASSLFCSSAVCRRPFTSASSCSDWLDCWEAAGPWERTMGIQRKNKQF